MRAARKTVKMIVIDVKARPAVGMERADNLAVAERLTNQIGERDLLLLLRGEDRRGNRLD